MLDLHTSVETGSAFDFWNVGLKQNNKSKFVFTFILLNATVVKRLNSKMLSLTDTTKI